MSGSALHLLSPTLSKNACPASDWRLKEVGSPNRSHLLWFLRFFLFVQYVDLYRRSQTVQRRPCRISTFFMNSEHASETDHSPGPHGSAQWSFIGPSSDSSENHHHWERLPKSSVRSSHRSSKVSTVARCTAPGFHSFGAGRTPFQPSRGTAGGADCVARPVECSMPHRITEAA